MATLEELKRQILIESIIEEDLQPTTWRRSGDNIFTLCPFHSETKPSFSISTANQFFYCFGCHATGDVIEWIKRRMKIGVSDAAAILAKRTGIAWINGDESGTMRVLKAAGHTFLEHATKNLRKNKTLLAYLKKRGVSTMIDDFRLGYSSSVQDAIAAVAEEYGDEIAHSLELNKPDLTEDTLIMPVLDPRGGLVRLYAHRPGEKYVGTSKHMPLWDERYNAYGIHSLTPKTEKILFVEGHFDTLFARANGIPALGLMGTTIREVVIDDLFKRGYRHFCFMFDGDAAGQAAYQQIDSSLPGLLYVAFCEDGKDPATMSAVEIERRLRESRSLVEWRIDTIVQHHNIKTVTGKIQAVDELHGLCSQISDTITRKVVLTAIEKKLGIKLDEIDLLSSSVEKSLAVPDHETRLLRLASRDPYALSQLLILDPTDFSTADARRGFEEIVTRWRIFEGKNESLNALYEHLKQDPNTVWLTAEPSDGPEVDFLVSEIKERGKRRRISAALREVDLRLTDVMTPLSEIVRSASGVLHEGSLDHSTSAFTPKSLADETHALIIRRMALDTRTIGIPLSGRWQPINDIWGGIESKRYHLIAGVTSSGKSACAINWAVDIGVENRIPCLYITGELDPVDVMLRAASIISGVSCTKILTGDLNKVENLSVEQALEDYRAGRLHVIRSRMYLSHWMTAIEAYTIKHGIKVVFIDYIQQVQREKEHHSMPQYQIIEQASSRLQDRAYSDRCPLAIVAVCQLNRAAAEHGAGGAQYIGGAFGLAQDCDKHLQIIMKSRNVIAEQGSQRGNRIFVNEKNRSGRQGHRFDGYLDDGETYGTGTIRMGIL